MISVNGLRGSRIFSGALVFVNPDSRTPQVIPFQYNPNRLQRSLEPQMAGGDENNRSLAIRYTGAPVEIINIDIQLDASDKLCHDDPITVQLGIYPYLAALELLAFPSLNQVQKNQSLLANGTLEVASLTSPDIYLVWGLQRVLPVRINSYTIVEELFDARLNPLRATVSLSMRVLNYSDLSSSNPQYHQFSAYQNILQSMSRSAINTSSQMLEVNINQLR
ncbi:MAG: hypothetical protein IM473_15200 [Microcystis sp. M015S2]|uniref:hypothetical protein n=1 Tax=unclassified Microcystis TaxID=2643300 RepID=UPI00258B4EC2|nr:MULTISPECIES: hypothetical protein [unclassified Microcystis]MCA2711496.1 hypothetical protein [Microcystis sp. M025S2]MCA2743703.1 hypothetical protein [Microcystis sp. M015S2]MCA2759814.1 hypothetical protein [Microcystis sp. M145S2]